MQAIFTYVESDPSIVTCPFESYKYQRHLSHPRHHLITPTKKILFTTVILNPDILALSRIDTRQTTARAQLCVVQLLQLQRNTTGFILLQVLCGHPVNFPLAMTGRMSCTIV